jgi:hypothetical protein
MAAWSSGPPRLHAMVGLPATIVVDNGPEFAGRTLDACDLPGDFRTT